MQQLDVDVARLRPMEFNGDTRRKQVRASRVVMRDSIGFPIRTYPTTSGVTRRVDFVFPVKLEVCCLTMQTGPQNVMLAL